MRQEYVFRLLAWRLLEQAFITLRALPFEYNARAGVLRLNGEPLVLPRRWHSGDADAQRLLAAALQRVWDVLTDSPLGMDGSDEGGTCLRIWSYRVSAWRPDLREDEHLDDGSQRPFPDDGGFATLCEFVMPGVEPCHEHLWAWSRTGERPDMDAELPALLRHVVAAELRGFLQPGEGQEAAITAFAGELASLFADELVGCLGRGTWRDAVIVLIGHLPGLTNDEYLFLPRDSTLQRRGIGLCRTDVDALTAGKSAANFQQLFPFAVLAGRGLLVDAVVRDPPPVPASVVAGWLRANGLSRRSLARLHRLPSMACHDFANLYALQLPGSHRHGMDWLNRLLSAMWQRRHRVLDEADLCAAAEVAAMAGVVADRSAQSGLRWRQADPRPAECFIEFDMPVSHAQACIGSTMNLLARHGMACIEAYATTLMHAFLGDAGVAREEVVGALQDIYDWVYGVTCSEPHLCEVLSPARLGLGWAQLMRGQQRWHDAFMRRCAGLPPEVQRRVDAGLIRRPQEAEAAAPAGSAFAAAAWDAPCPVFTVGDLDVVPLATSAALAEEGRRMQHCVGNYTHECLVRGNRVFSLRHAFDGESVATALFAPGRDGWRLVQLRGFRNALLLTRSGHVHPAYADALAELHQRLEACRPLRGRVA